MHDGCARDHLERRDLRKIGNQRVGHAVREVLLSWVAGKVCQRKNRQGLDSGDGSAPQEAITNLEGVQGKERGGGERNKRDDSRGPTKPPSRACRYFLAASCFLDARCNVGAIHRRDESVTTARQRLNVAGSVGIVTQSLAKLLDSSPDAVFILNNGSIQPQLGDDLLWRHNVAGMLEQQAENLERLLLKLDFASIAAQFSRCKIQLKEPETDGPGAVSAFHWWTTTSVVEFTTQFS